MKLGVRDDVGLMSAAVHRRSGGPSGGDGFSAGMGASPHWLDGAQVKPGVLQISPTYREGSAHAQHHIADICASLISIIFQFGYMTSTLYFLQNAPTAKMGLAQNICAKNVMSSLPDFFHFIMCHCFLFLKDLKYSQFSSWTLILWSHAVVMDMVCVLAY